MQRSQCYGSLHLVHAVGPSDASDEAWCAVKSHHETNNTAERAPLVLQWLITHELAPAVDIMKK